MTAPEGGKPDGTKKIPARQCIGCMTSRPKKGTGAGGARPQRRDQHRPRGQEAGPRRLPLPGPGLSGKGQKRKKALERCFEQPVPAEVYDALAVQLADVEKEAQPNGEA